MSRKLNLANRVLLALILLLCLTGLLVPVAARKHRAITSSATPVQSEWDLIDYVHYAGWRVGICKAPPFIYLVDEIQKIEPDSTILDREPDGVLGENPPYDPLKQIQLPPAPPHSTP